MIWMVACTTQTVCDSGYALANDGVCYVVAGDTAVSDGDSGEPAETVEVAAPGDGGDGDDGGDSGGDGGDSPVKDTGDPVKSDYHGAWDKGTMTLNVDAEYGDLETDVCTGSLDYMAVVSGADPEVTGEVSCSMNEGSDIGAAFGMDQHAAFEGSLDGDTVSGEVAMFGGALSVPIDGTFSSENAFSGTIDATADVGFKVHLTGSIAAWR